MAKKPNKKDASPELTLAEERSEAIKEEIALALVKRNTLPPTASDEQKEAASAHVEQLQAEHHESVQNVLAIRHEETTKLEKQHKEKKLRQRRLKASRLPEGHATPQEEPNAPARIMPIRPPIDRVEEEARMDAANEEDFLLEQERLDEEDRDSAEELAHQRRIAARKQRKEEVAERKEARKRKLKKAQEEVAAARLKTEKEERAGIRQQAALQRAEEAKATKRQQSADREARQRAVRDVQSSGWFSDVLQQLKAFFRGSR